MKFKLMISFLSLLPAVLLAPHPTPAETLVYSTDFEGLTAAQLTSHPGLVDQDWWYTLLGGAAIGEIASSGGNPGQCLDLLAPASASERAQTFGVREFPAVDLAQIGLLRISFDFRCSTSDLTTQNTYLAEFSGWGAPHPGYPISTISLLAGHTAPRDQTGLDLVVAYYEEGVGGGLPHVPAAGENLTWDSWHSVEVVIDQANDRYISVAIDGQEEDISHMHPPRAHIAGEFIRGQFLDKLQGVIYSFEWGDPVQETDDLVRFDNIDLSWEYLEEPAITGIRDVGNDQGRQVRLHWLRSEHDAPAGPSILSYDIYRRQEEGRLEKGRLGGWDYVMSVPAAGDDQYQCTVPTLGDSTAAGIMWSTFLLRAMTTDPLEFYQSEPDSGYSVDNLTPEAVQEFWASYTVNGVDLSWSVSQAPDSGTCMRPSPIPSTRQLPWHTRSRTRAVKSGSPSTTFVAVE